MMILNHKESHVDWVNIFRVLNIAMMVLDIPFIVWATIQVPLLFSVIMSTHALILMPSLYFHMGAFKPTTDDYLVVPIVTTFFVIIIGIPGMIGLLLSMRHDPFDIAGFAVGIAPLFFIGGSFSLYFWSNFLNQPKRLIVVPQGEIIYQEAMI